jgi:hypothetical protein|tara:strand:+ start:561 stop:1052 length:492 start_codon:yes stop_codon:yes gene_type:complete
MSSLYTELRRDYLRTWRLWYAINQRCNPEWRKKWGGSNNCYYDIVEDWSIKEAGQDGFLNFFDDMGDCDNVENLYRKDTKQAYGPGNCFKGTFLDKSKHTATYNTPKAIGNRLAAENKIPQWVYYNRVNVKGWTPTKAATKPYYGQRKPRTFTQKLAGLIGLQ